MKRIDSSTAVIDKYGIGKNGFTVGNVQTGVKATALNADFCNGLQEEIMAVIEGAGLIPSGNNNAQLFAAINIAITNAINNKFSSINGCMAINGQS